MKNIKYLVIPLIISLFIIFSCGPEKKYSLVRLKSAEDTVSYYLGLYYGSGWKQSNMDSVINSQAFAKGINTAFYGDTLPVSMMEIQTYINDYYLGFQRKQLQIQYKDYIVENKTFLEENAKKDSVVSLPSGLQYKILNKSNGVTPSLTDVVVVNYKASTIDGRVFDSSGLQDGPFQIQVNQVIPGWTEALQHMPVGSTWTIYIPENLAYGSNPPPNSGIQPFSTLIFELELLGIVSAE